MTFIFLIDKIFKKRCSFIFFLFVILLFFSNSIFGQQPLKEVRAIWLTTLDYLDWPNPVDHGNIQAQQSSLIRILDKLQQLNINTIFFQVRPRGNVFYKSSYEPWAKELTGKLGQDPGWDPLEFITQEANKRGFELHAWININKIWSGNKFPSTPNHLINKYQKWCKYYQNEWWLDFGYPEARKYTLKIVEEILTNYKIDGLHFDYLRYPGKDFNDDDSYNLYGKGLKKDYWRRENINSFLRDIKQIVLEKKPFVKIGVAPIGIYKNVQGLTGLSSYDNLFQDTKYWLENKLVDYITPQTYWDLDNTPRDPSFEKAIIEWTKMKNNIHIYPGIAIYKQKISNEIEKYIKILRNYKFDGFAFFRVEHTLSNLHLFNSLKKISQIPNVKNIQENFNNHDLIVYAESANNKLNLSWSSTRNDIKFFNIYKLNNGEKELIKIIGRKNNNIELDTNKSSNYAITFTTNYNNESFLFYPQKITIANKIESDFQKDTIPNTLENLLNTRNDIIFKDFYLACYPNPFYDYLLLGYEINDKLPIELTIFDLYEKEVLKVIKGIQLPGKYVLKIDGNRLKKGFYFCRLRVGDKSKQKIITKK